MSSVHKLNDNRCLVEFLATCEEDDTTATTTMEALAVSVDPKDCSRIVKALGQFFPLPPSLNHLKRVKNTTIRKEQQQQIHSKDDTSDRRANKRSKHDCDNGPMRTNLQVLVGLHPIATILRGNPSINMAHKDEGKDLPIAAANLVKIFLGSSWNQTNPVEVLTEMLHPVKVPAKPPQSQDQANAANQLWPTHFFPLKSMEYRHQQLALSPNDLSSMFDMMDKVHGHDVPVAIVVDPSKSFAVIATSWDEQEHQVGSANNPLSTPILWAIQGVSRLERQNNEDRTTTTTATQHPHYLCTNFDLYCNYEPTIFEAMASVHSRFGRLVFSRQHDRTRNKEGAVVAWRNAISRHAIHCLPGTNHHYRAFEYTICDC